MRKLVLVAVLLLGCKHDEDKLAKARRSAEEAQQAAHKAEGEAAEAKQKLDKALAEQQQALESKQDVEKQLAEARQETADIIELAKKKLAELKVERAKASPARQKEIDAQIAKLTSALSEAGSAQSPP